MVGDGLDRFKLEVNIVNAELVVEPDDLGVEEILWNPSTLGDVLLDCLGVSTRSGGYSSRYNTDLSSSAQSCR